MRINIGVLEGREYIWEKWKVSEDEAGTKGKGQGLHWGCGEKGELHWSKLQISTDH